jgi:hypothetical protein
MKAKAVLATILMALCTAAIADTPDQEQQRLQAEIQADNQRQEAERAEHLRRIQESRHNSVQAAAQRKQQLAAVRNDVDREEADYQRATQAKAAAAKAACGKDYLNLQIGMTLQRAQQCVGTFTISGKTHTERGIITSYSSDTTRIDTLNGHVVSWAQY